MTMPLRFVTFLAPNMAPVYRFLADRIGQRLGRRVELVVGRSFDQFEQGEVDLGVICGLPFVWLAARQPPSVEPLAAAVLAGDRYAGRPIYYSDVIVRHDSPITCLEELEGRSWDRALLPLSRSSSRHLASPFAVRDHLRNAGRHSGEPLKTRTQKATWRASRSHPASGQLFETGRFCDSRAAS
jgi:hypothetical protein